MACYLFSGLSRGEVLSVFMSVLGRVLCSACRFTRACLWGGHVTFVSSQQLSKVCGAACFVLGEQLSELKGSKTFFEL